MMDDEESWFVVVLFMAKQSIEVSKQSKVYLAENGDEQAKIN